MSARSTHGLHCQSESDAFAFATSPAAIKSLPFSPTQKMIYETVGFIRPDGLEG